MDRYKPPSFVIPKKRRLCEDQTEPVIPDGYRINKATSEEYEEVVRQMSKKTSAVSLEDFWKIVFVKNIDMIKNAKLEHNFKAFKNRVGVSEEFYGYRLVNDPAAVHSIARHGICVDSDCFGDIGDTSQGVLMYSSPAVANGGSVVFKNKPITMIMFRTVRGKCFEMQIGSGGIQPSNKHNCHIPYVIRAPDANPEIPQLLKEHRQGSVYHYEFTADQKGVRKYPSQLLPYAIITFERNDKPRNGYKQIYNGPVDFQLYGDLEHRITLGQKTLRGQVHRLYNLQVYPDALYLRLRPARVCNVKSDFEAFDELKFIKNLSPGKIFNMETLSMNSHDKSAVAVYNVMTVRDEHLETLTFLRNGGYFLVTVHHPWTIFYIPSGSLATELGLPFTPNHIHMIVCRQNLNSGTRDNVFIGANQSTTALHGALVYDYAKMPRPEHRETKDNSCGQAAPHPEPASPPVVIPESTTIHPTLTNPVGKSILKAYGQQSRGLKVSFREKITDVREFSSEKEVEADEKPIQEKPPLSFDEQRKEEQRNKETTNLFKGAIEKSREGRIAETVASQPAVKPVENVPAGRPSERSPLEIAPGTSSMESRNSRDEAPSNRSMAPPTNFLNVPRGPPPLMFQPVPQVFMGVPPPVPPPFFPCPLPPHFFPDPRGFPPGPVPMGPFDARFPPPMPAGSPGISNVDFSRPPPPPPPTILPIAPPTASSSSAVESESDVVKSEEKADDDMEVDMDISMEESQNTVVKEEEPQNTDEAGKKGEKKDKEENYILKMAFEQAPRVQTTPSTIEQIQNVVKNLSNKDQFLNLLTRAKTQKPVEEPTKAASSSAQDVDMRTPGQVTFAVNKAPSATINSNFLHDYSSSSHSSQDTDYRIHPSSSSQNKGTTNRDDRPKDTDGRVKPNEKVLTNIPMPKHSSKEEEGRKKLDQQLQEKMRANSKNVDQAIMNQQVGNAMTHVQNFLQPSAVTAADLSTVCRSLSNLKNFRVTAEGLTKATPEPASETPAQRTEEPVQIRSPSPEAREAYVPSSFLITKEAREIPTKAKEGYETFYGAQETRSVGGEQKSGKTQPKKVRDYDSDTGSLSKINDAWSNIISQKSRTSGVIEKDTEKGEAEASIPGSSGSFNPISRPPGEINNGPVGGIQAGPSVRGNVFHRGRGRGRGHLLPTPRQPYNGPFVPSPNGFPRGRGGGYFNNDHSYSRPASHQQHHYLNQLQPVADSSADHYCVFIDPELSTGNTQPNELDALFNELTKLNRSLVGSKVTVFVHSSLMNHMRDNTTELRHFYHAFNNFNNPQNRLIEVLPNHGCDGFCAPKATNLAFCMSNVNTRKRGKEAIFLSNSCRGDSESGRAFASRGHQVMSIRQLRRYLEEEGHFFFTDL